MDQKKRELLDRTLKAKPIRRLSCLEQDRAPLVARKPTQVPRKPTLVARKPKSWHSKGAQVAP